MDSIKKYPIDNAYKLEDGYLYSDAYLGYCREHAVKKFRKWLETRDVDISKVKIVHTHSFQLLNFEHSYQFVYKIDDKGNLDRPPCVECGSLRVISKGVMWLCKDCGRWFSKIHRGSFILRERDLLVQKYGDFIRRFSLQIGSNSIWGNCYELLRYDPQVRQIFIDRGITSLNEQVQALTDIILSYKG